MFSNSISAYNSLLSESLDMFAPVKQKVIKDVPKAPWFDREYFDLRKNAVKQKKNGAKLN